MKEYDVITIGAGGACYPAAFRLRQSDYNVLMVDEKGVMSGNCLSEGCVPSKTIIETVHNYKRMKEFYNFRINYSDIIKRKDYVQDIRYKSHNEELNIANLEVLKGTASIIDKNTVEVSINNDINSKERFHYKHLIIGSGATTSVLKIEGYQYCITSKDLYAFRHSMDELPESIAIIGAGYIGIETASFLSILGVRVELIEIMDSVLKGMDIEAVNKLLPLLPEMNLHLNNSVQSIEKHGDKFKVNIMDKDNKSDNVIVDKVLMATGRSPVIPDGIKDLGIEYDRKGIRVNSGMQTNIKNIYAAGDVNGIAPLFHAAKRQSLIAAHNIMNGDKLTDYFDPFAVPFTLFTIPQMAFVGLLPDELNRRGINYIRTTYDIKGDSLAEAYNEMYGEIDLFFEENSMKILGGYIIGNDAGNIINEIALGIEKGLTARDFAEMSHQHPMTFEGLDTAARKLY